MRVLVTGAAGFIGMHTAIRLLDRGDEVVGIDNLSTYYSVELKRARLGQLSDRRNFKFERIDVEDPEAFRAVVRDFHPNRVVHMAAQVGVRYSLENPSAYLRTNVMGFGNVLEACRLEDVEHLVYASSSSVYGGNARHPFSEHDNVDHPVSLYAATKKANELMAHSYSHLYRLPTTGLRFFTVYGPWGRPDMSPILFARAMLEGREVELFNEGKMARDYTYVDDVVEGVVRVLDKAPAASPDFDPGRPDPSSSNAPYRLFNIGNSRPTSLMDFVRALEEALGVKARAKLLPLQPGDMLETSADTHELGKWVGFRPSTSLDTGVRRFAEWFNPTGRPDCPAPTTQAWRVARCTRPPSYSTNSGLITPPGWMRCQQPAR